MTLLLDTSAINGWLERNNSSLPALFETSDTALYHPVTLGELHAGIERADNDAELEMRTNTFHFTRRRLQAVEEDVLPAEQFGFLTASFRRNLSHNDYWIVATTIASTGLTLVTEDAKLFDVVTSDEFTDALTRRNWVCPPCRLVESTPIQPEN